MKVKDIVNKVYPAISKYYNSNAKVELYSDIYERLDSIPALDEHEFYAEYSWNNNMIYLYTNHLESEEDVIRSLIHECVHSNQCYELYEALYECDLDYDTHPYEIEAEYEEEKWKKYKLNTITNG
jgi:transglutaminase-like putative cysteine protease